MQYKSLFDYLKRNINQQEFTVEIEQREDYIIGYIYPVNGGDTVDFICRESDDDESIIVLSDDSIFG
jgi:hypothetical protein